MPSTCTFTFDHLDNVYYSGETINGRITLCTTTEKIVRGVFIIFEGKAKVIWQEQGSDSGINHDEETYANTQTKVFGDGILPPGIHEYTFSIPLPFQCPTTCKEKAGKIKYTVTLKLERALRFDNEFRQTLTVIQHVNLNDNPALLLPIQTTQRKTFRLWPFSASYMILTLKIPHSGWIPGQDIICNLEIDNQTNSINMINYKIKLIQCYIFTARRPVEVTLREEKTLAKLEQSGIGVRHMSMYKFKNKLHIPQQVPPTSMDNLIIKISYRLELQIWTGILSRKSKICIPIIIGTVPFFLCKHLCICVFLRFFYAFALKPIFFILLVTFILEQQPPSTCGP